MYLVARLQKEARMQIFGAPGLPLHPWYFRLAPAYLTALTRPGHLGGRAGGLQPEEVRY